MAVPFEYAVNMMGRSDGSVVAPGEYWAAI